MVGIILKVLMIIVGLYLCFKIISSLAKRKMTDVVAMVWMVFSVCLILAGAILTPYGINHIISYGGLIIVLIGLCGGIFLLWNMSIEISELNRKNLELAIQVSLLNQEHDRVQKELEALTGKSHEELWR